MVRDRHFIDTTQHLNKEKPVEERAWTAARYRNNRNEGSGPQIWVKFGKLDKIHYTGKKESIRGFMIYNEQGESLMLDRKNYKQPDSPIEVQEAQQIKDAMQEALDEAFQQMVAKIYANKDVEVAVALDSRKVKPNYFLDITDAKNLERLTHNYTQWQGQTVFLNST